MADLIQKTDTLNQGREKLNTAITDAETAKIVSEQADDKATQALAKSESTQTQLDTIVIEGDSSVEAAQARVSVDGTAYGTLKQRLDTEYEEVTSQLAQITHFTKDFGIVGDGVTDDTQAINNAILSLNRGDTLRFEKGKQYKISNVLVKRSGIELHGNGSTLLVFGDGASAFLGEGTTDGVHIHGFKCKPFSQENKRQFFYFSKSNQHLTNFVIENNEVEDVMNGISMNADLGGVVDGFIVRNNIIKNLNGIASGEGYGIHLAGATNCDVYENTVENATRHSIYHAWGENNSIHHNRIINHKKDIPETTIVRSALPIFRGSKNIDVYNNYFINCSNACIQIWNDGWDNVDHLSYRDMENINVYNNFIIGLNNAMAVYIGGTATTFAKKMVNINFNNNLISSMGNYDSVNKQHIIFISRGINVNVNNNKVYLHGIASRIHAFYITADDASVAENYTIQNNEIEFKGPDISQCRAFYYGQTLNESTIKCNTENNVLLNHRGNSGTNYIASTNAVTNTNPNLSPVNQNVTLYRDQLPSSGYYLFNDIILKKDIRNSNLLGWKCVASGNVGTWSEIYFGAKYKTHDTTIDVTVNANSTFNHVVSGTGIAHGDVVTVSPPSNIEQGIVYSVFVTTSGDVVIRLANLTGTPITLDSKTWRINALSV